LISDGCDTSSRKASLDSVMKKALATGVNIYCVDLMDSSDLNGSTQAVAELRRGRSDMQNFSRETGAKYVNSPQGDTLEEAFNQIIEELRNQYTLTYYSTNDKRDGKWRKLNVTTSRPSLSVRARRGYYAPKG
jgi:Ca-activated chloride channel family protein